MLPLSQWEEKRSSSTCTTQLVRFFVMPPPPWNVLSTSLEHHSSTIETEMEKQYRHSFTGFCFFLWAIWHRGSDKGWRWQNTVRPSPRRSHMIMIAAVLLQRIAWKFANMTGGCVKTSADLAGKRFLARLSPAELQQGVFYQQKGKLLPGCGFIHPRQPSNIHTSRCCVGCTRVSL